MSAPELVAAAAWDVPLLRAQIAELASVSERLPAWRFRLDEAGRALETVECWAGPAAGAAAAALLEVSAVATAVSRGIAESQDVFQRLTSEAARAQEQAAEALAREAALTAAAGAEPLPGLRGAGVDPRTEAALHDVAAARATARRTGEPLSGLAGGGGAPADFSDLAVRAGGEVLPRPPLAGTPRDVAIWWAALPQGAREAEIGALPALVGGLDGVPAWARDRANRLLLRRSLAEPGGGGPVAAATAAQLAHAEAEGQRPQLFTFDPQQGTVALSYGDLDTAEAVALLVPGMRTTVADLPGLADSARGVALAARDAAPGIAVAAVAWLGYRTPENLWQAADPRLPHAVRGARALDGALQGLAATRAASGAPAARTTVLAHSYGTEVVDQAARRPGRLAAQAVVLLGSPGIAGNHASSLEAPEVYDAASPLDGISWSGWHGTETWEWGFGSEGLPVDLLTTHGGYYEPDHPTLAAMGQVVAGTYRR